jgi:imidazolonepropionase-like amidohydrolase
MRRRSLTLAMTAPFAWRLAPAQAAGVFAFENASVLTMENDRVLDRQTVVVADGRIAALAPDAPVPAGAQRIDARGKFLMPGLAEMHGHVGGSPEALERILFLYLSNGVTTVRGMLGQPTHLELRAKAARGEILSPTLFTSGPSFNGNSVPDPETGRRMVLEQKGAGYDLLKIHPGLSRAAYDAIAAAARDVGIPFAGHVPAAVGLRRALEARQLTVDHLDGYVEALVPESVDTSTPSFFGFGYLPQVDERRIPAIVAATRAAGAWNVPTQSLLEHMAGPITPEELAARPEMRYMPQATVQQWLQQARNIRRQAGADPAAGARFVELRRRLIRALQERGAGLLLGSDAPQVFNVPGFSLQHEMRMLVTAGLTPYQVLKSGTREPAVHFGAEKEFGTVAVGKRADLILLDANPLADITAMERIAGVMVRGRWLPQAEIRRRLDEIAARV